jgi:hypothetical protein
MDIAGRNGEAGERAEVSPSVAQLMAEDLPERQITLDGVGQHGAVPGHGLAISDRRPKSTLA